MSDFEYVGEDAVIWKKYGNKTVAAEVADLKAALSRGWLQRKESNPSQMSKRGGNLAECCDCGECGFCREVLLRGEFV